MPNAYLAIGWCIELIVPFIKFSIQFDKIPKFFVQCVKDLEIVVLPQFGPTAEELRRGDEGRKSVSSHINCACQRRGLRSPTKERSMD